MAEQKSCQCGYRAESPQTHPHVLGCQNDSPALAGLETLLKEWRQKAIDLREEAGRIRRTVYAATDAEERCNVRAEIYDKCAEALSAALRTLLAERENLLADRPVLEPLKLNLYGRACYRAGQQSIRAERDTTEAETYKRGWEAGAASLPDVESLQGQLRAVDMVLDRRDALAYSADRVDKIVLLLKLAQTADPRGALAKAEGILAEKDAEIERLQAHLLTTEASVRAPTTEPSTVADPRDGDLAIPMAALERDWVEHAAKLRNLPLVEYVRRAINLSLMSEGVDAVLLAQSDDDGPCACGALEGDECACPALGDDGEDGVMF